MPNILLGGQQSPTQFVPMTKIEYRYPRGLNLEPNSPVHNKIITEVWRHCFDSSAQMSRRYPYWKKVDQTLTAYIRPDDAELKVKQSDDRKPISIVVPYSYATLETLLTYFVAAFLENPYFRYEGVSPEDIKGAALMQLVVDMHCMRNKVGLALHTMFRDSLSYGFGVVAPKWTKETGSKIVLQDRVAPFFSKMFNLGKQRVMQPATLFEGNELWNIDPYLYLPDPNVPIHLPQRGEFVGWIEMSNYMSLMELEKKDPDVVNVQYLSQLIGGSGISIFNKAKNSTGRDVKTGGNSLVVGSSTRPIDVIWQYINLIPHEWGLGGSSDPEKWLFGVAADRVVICAKPMGLAHNKFPVAVCAPDYDGYSVTPISRMEITYGLQETLDWLFNCYDDQTEVLTERGWVLLSATKEDDKVATVSPITRELWFEKPKQWFEYDYSGSLINFKSSRMDICVTPNHNMFVRDRYKGEWGFTPAVNVALQADKEYKTIGNVNWVGVPPKSLVFDGKSPIRDRGKKPRYQELEVNPMAMAGFLGWFLSEGSISQGKTSGSYSVAIKQAKEEHTRDINSLLSALPFHVTTTYDIEKHATQWTITDKRLYTWLKDNCYEGGTTSEFKKVPNFVRDWDEFHLYLLFERAMWGDGYWMPGHENLGNYGSRSKALVDGMQEIAIRLGYFSHIRESKTSAGKPFFLLQISTAETNPSISTRNCHRVVYSGKVYCFENSTHLTITRRNGKVAIQGQSHITNVRKAINDMLIYDPSLVNANDLKDPAPGKLIRMRRAAWGRGVDKAVAQLNVQDVTKGHITDAGYIVDLFQRISAATDSLSGIARKEGERVSAKEAGNVYQSSLSRLTKAAKIASLQAMGDIGYFFANHTQQLMSQDVYVKQAGQWPAVLEAEYPNASRIKTSPFDLIVEYDLMIKDGSIVHGGETDLWTSMFQTLAQNPALWQQIDIVKVFTHIARKLGAKDVYEFVKQQPVQTSVQSPEAIERAVQAGNLVPATEGGMR